jgi:ligand-binding sensor domain-containing protein
MKKQIFWGFTFLFCLLSTTVAAQDLLKSEYSYRQYTTQDGLPELITASVFQDSRGFIWVGTLSGFARFDGKSFKSYAGDTEQTIVGFSENENGDVLALGLKAIFKVSRDNDDSYTAFNSVPDAADSYLYLNSKSLPVGYGLYLINKSPALYAITDTGIVKVWEHELLNQLKVTNKKLYWDRMRKRFFIPTEQGLFIVGEDGEVKDSVNITTIHSIIPHLNALWAVADDGLYTYNENEWQHVLVYDFFGGYVKEYDLLEDSEQHLIIRTNKCTFRYANGKLEVVANNRMQDRDMCLDREGNLWMAGADGLYNFFRLNFKSYTLQPEGSVSQSIIVDKQNRIWLPSLDGRIIRLEGEQAMEIKYPPSPYGYSFFERGSIRNGDDLYLPGGGTVLQFNTATNRFNWLNVPLEDYLYFDILPNGNMMTGTTNSLVLFHPEEGIKQIYGIDRLKQMILNVISDKDGTIWMGGATGVASLKGDSIRFWEHELLKVCRALRFDVSGKLWLICQNRLVSIEGESIRLEYTFPKSLRDIFITSKGLLIVATIDALYISAGTTKPEFIRYNQENGFTVPGVMEGTIAEDMDGNVWIPTLGSVVRFNPEKLLYEQPVPMLHLQALQTSTDNIKWENADQSGNRIEAGYKNNNAKFTYVGLCYSATNNVRYHYRLKGFQEDWSDPQLNNEVVFNNLPSGDYTFEVYADAGSDVSHSEVQSIPFTIHPAFWQTTWFIVAAILTLMLASAGIALFYQRRKNKDLFEKLETEKQLNDLRIRSIRLKAIPHFNANVLAAIEYYIMNMSKTEALRLLGIYSRFTFQTLREVDKASRSLNEELEYVKMYLELEKLRFVNKFDYKIEIEPTVDADNVQLPNMILHTYCENAVKHGLSSKNGDGALNIKIIQSGDLVCVSVEDNGVGREAAARNKNIPSSKQGLDILSRQIEIYNRFNATKINQKVDDLYADGQPSGTRFTVEVPYGFVYQ